MNNAFIPKIGMNAGSNPFQSTLSGHVSSSIGGMSGQLLGPQGLQSINGVQGSSFKDVLSNTLHNVDQTLQAPDALMKDAMTTGNVDVHDVMIANAKAELTLTIATQMTTKVIQAYDRILQIQI